MRSRPLHANPGGALILVAAALCIALCGFRSARADAGNDVYTLALSWEPGFCGTGDHATLPECKLAANGPPRLVLHGLWPDWDVNGDGKRDAADDYCLPGADDRKALVMLDTARPTDWLKLPAVKLSAANSGDLAGVMPGTAAALERHEWWKHGTCSGLQPDEYFALAILLMRQAERGKLASLIVAQAGKTVARSKLFAAFAADFGPESARALLLDCAKAQGDSALLEIHIRLKRDKISEGLNPDTLSIPDASPHGSCAVDIRILDWKK